METKDANGENYGLMNKRSSVITHEPRREERDNGKNRDRSRSPLNRGEKVGAQEESIYISSSPTTSEIFDCNSSHGDAEIFSFSSVSSYQSLSSQVSISTPSSSPNHSGALLDFTDLSKNPASNNDGAAEHYDDDETGRAVRALERESFLSNDVTEGNMLLELLVQHPVDSSTPKRHRLAPPTSARFATPALQKLPALLHDHSWMDKCEVIIVRKKRGLSVREALFQAGVCLTEVIMDTLKICPNGLHLQSQEHWYSKTQLTARALRLILPRLGLIDYAHENYQKVYSSVQRFSGTYIFLKHALDHGNFPDELQALQYKATRLRETSAENPELQRCLHMNHGPLGQQCAPTDLSVPRHDRFVKYVAGENMQLDGNGENIQPCANICYELSQPSGNTDGDFLQPSGTGGENQEQTGNIAIMLSSDNGGENMQLVGNVGVEIMHSSGNEGESMQPTENGGENIQPTVDFEIVQSSGNESENLQPTDGGEENLQSVGINGGGQMMQPFGSDKKNLPALNGVSTTTGEILAPPDNEQRGALRLRDVNQMDLIPRASTKVLKPAQQENIQSTGAGPALKENQTMPNINAN